MIVYRLTKERYATDISGKGSALGGGRWNKKGIPVLYTSENSPLAILEYSVNTDLDIMSGLVMVMIQVPNSVTEVDIATLPENWADNPAPTSLLSEYTERWIKENPTLALKVPSSVDEEAFNYILNCSHPDYHKVKIDRTRPFKLDMRLKKY